mmetsp:Transcript_27719/g.34266  ORF Transcript_27719/g.34266 Transcript_27719/m.34266 type:complete len:222 (+) Transcript_27719:220-885(+)
MTTTSTTATTTPSTTESGSQTADQLHILCRLLLLQAQYVYHNHRQEQTILLEKIDKEEHELNKSNTRMDYSVVGRGRNRSGGGSGSVGNRGGVSSAMRNYVEMKPPPILQSCVALGSKFILERKVRKVLKHLAIWKQKKIQNSTNQNQNNLKVEWLSLSTFDLSSQFTLSLDEDYTMDVNICNGKISVSSFAMDGTFRVVYYRSSEEFELFVKNEMLRLLD